MTQRLSPPHPIPGVAAVIFREGTQTAPEVLLIRRAKPPAAGEWSLPGGAVETGERLRDALAREVREEVQLDVLVGPLLEVVPLIQLDDSGALAYHFIIFDFLCTLTPPFREPTPSSDAADAHWVSIRDLSQYQLSSVVLNVITKAQDRWSQTSSTVRVHDLARPDDLLPLS